MGLLDLAVGTASGVGGVDGHFVAGGHPSVPAAVAFLLLDAGVVAGLIPGVAEVGQHVRPQALVFGGHEAGQVVTRLNLQTEGSVFALHSTETRVRF